MKSSESKIGNLTFIMAIAFGIPVGTIVADFFDIESFLGGLLIMAFFSGLGAIIGCEIDKKIEVKRKANSDDH